MSVLFDSVELVTSSYAPKYVKHESTSLRNVALLELAREDGAVLISEKYGVKYITIVGSLKAASQSALETAIDNFKELFSRLEKNLDISWAGSTRRYVTTCVNHTFNRDHLNINFVPWAAEFVVASGIGKDTAITAELNAFAVNLSTELSDSVSLSGSAEPKPIFTVKFNEVNWPSYAAKGISIEGPNGEKVIHTKANGYVNQSELIFDMSLKKVTLAGVEVEFLGIFPTFEIGSNSYIVRAGGIIDQQFTGTVIGGQVNNIYGTVYSAQSFSVPFTDDSYGQIEVYVKKIGSPPGSLLVRIETDNNGEASGNLVHANATATIAAGSIGTSYSWVLGNFSGFFALNANTNYWIVMTSVASGIGNQYETIYALGLDATYKRGSNATTDDGGSTWNVRPSRDIRFKLKYGGQYGGGPAILDIDYTKRWL